MGQQRYTVRDAATHLGISESAVRNRLSRGTLESVREAGVTYVVLESDNDIPDDTPPGHGATETRDELVEQLRSEVAYLREENRRKDHLLAAALERVPAIEASETAPEDSGGVEEPPVEETEGSSRSSWWARLLSRR